MAAIDTALIATQKAHYPLTTCVVSGEPLGDAPKDILYGTHLVRFCCNGCIKDFKADPAPFLAKLAAASSREDGDHGHAEDHDDHGHGDGEAHPEGDDHEGHDHGGHDG
jgi:hypothetical protein